MTIKTIRAAIPGIFYRRPSPSAPAFVEENGSVTQGATIGLLEVMKTFTHVAAESAGRIVRFLVEDEEAVMAGDPLYEIDTGP